MVTEISLSGMERIRQAVVRECTYVDGSSLTPDEVEAQAREWARMVATGVLTMADMEDNMSDAGCGKAHGEPAHVHSQ